MSTPHTPDIEPGSSAPAPALSSTPIIASELPLDGAALLEPDRDTPRLRKGYLVAYFVALATLYAAWIAPAAFSLAIRIQALDPANKNAIVALVGGIPGFLVIVTGPVLGIISDRTLSRFGRRRPWIVVSIALGFIGTVLVAFAPNVAVVIIGWSIAYIGFTGTGGMLLTHLGDRLPEKQRGRVAGIGGALTQVGPIIGVVLAGALVSVPAAMFLVPAALGVVGVSIFLFVMKDSPITVRPPVDVKAVLEGFYFNPKRLPDLGWVWLSRALVFMALSLGVYGVYLLSGRLHLGAAAIAGVVAGSGAAAVPTAILGAVVCGFLSDRLKRRKPFLVASGFILASGLALIATSLSTTQYIVGTMVLSFAIGVYGAVDQAMFLDVIPVSGGENGRYLAIVNLANQIPQAAGPLLAGVVVGFAGGDYAWPYLVGAAAAVLGALAILPARRTRPPTEAIRTVAAANS